MTVNCYSRYETSFLQEIKFQPESLAEEPLELMTKVSLPYISLYLVCESTDVHYK